MPTSRSQSICLGSYSRSGLQEFSSLSPCGRSAKVEFQFRMRTGSTDYKLINGETPLTIRISSWPKRYKVTLLAFIGVFLMEILRANLSVAIVDMTSNRTVAIGNKIELSIDADYKWSSVEKGYILSAFSFGHCFTFLSGSMISKYGGAYIFGTGIALTAILATLTPLFLNIHVFVFLLSRVLQGLFEGVASSAVVDIFARWSPEKEKTRLISYAITGRMASVAVNFSLTGFVASKLGWQAVFYISGISTLIWWVFWRTFVSNDPAEDNFISSAERLYLKRSTTKRTSIGKVIIPWRCIWSSKAVYGIFSEYFTAAWAPLFVANYLPLYIKDVYNVDIKGVGLISSIPVWIGLVMMPIAAYIADYLRIRVLSNSQVHKLYISVGKISVLVPMLIAALWGDLILCIICFSVIRSGYSIAFTSYNVICMDIAGQYAAVIKSICISLYSVGTFLNPVVMGYMVPNKTQTEWHLYFFLLGVITTCGALVFFTIGSGETQPWAVVSKKEDPEISS